MQTIRLSSGQVKQWALEVGFDDCGIASYHIANEPYEALRLYLEADHHGSMQYLERHTDLRRDPALLLEGCRSVVMLYSRYTNVNLQNPRAPQIARYAYGHDYHHRIRRKLKMLLGLIQQNSSLIRCRSFVDSAPIFEKYWAVQAGLGWIGKNTLLLHPIYGSFGHLAVLLCDIELEADTVCDQRCAGCRICIEQCPTQALWTPYHLNASRCLAYASVEQKEQTSLKSDLIHTHCLFGCDRCQSHCPYNHVARIKPWILEDINPFIVQSDLQQWLKLDEATFKHLFANSSLTRQGFELIRARLEAMRELA